jgi:hypothetical protein
MQLAQRASSNEDKGRLLKLAEAWLNLADRALQHGETIAAAVSPSSPRSKEAGPVPGMRQPRGAMRGVRYRRLPFPAVRIREMRPDPSAQNIRRLRAAVAPAAALPHSITLY